ncbi:DNA cytosine methyltransferase [Pseudomonas sp. PDM13]|uniref:DNA cytosine methyltransferase n=1 Tax=Pseudomonas sp. PDM13 TaxID=2769255 RepID=UPI0021DF61B0|nr:DNA cytosine methyltransferase [Pseudomonas sp. PDM13]MCU9947544.1 DNA cytosine methyltransferase [Pseudomonas sp. PDM13]
MTSMQKSANLDFKTQYGLPLDEADDAIIVDLFAGGGGASTGLELGLGRQVALAINHNPAAISMHEANHPHADHKPTDVWGIDPIESSRGRTVAWLHASPDCRHHSQAAGGQPRKKEIRDLSWVVVKWAGKLQKSGQGPWVISLENVKQILQWGPLIAKRDKATGRVVKVDKSVAAPGEHVPRHEQFLVPDPKRKGRTWRQFVQTLRGFGYQVEFWVERNCDYGDPTTRQRLYMIATADGVMPEAAVKTHAAKPAKGQKYHRTAAECIDWSDLGQSIRTRKKPLAEATMRRIAKGIEKEVLQRAQPFIVPLTHQGGDRLHSLSEPFRTITAANRGELALAAPALVQVCYGEREGQAPRVLSLDKPLGTVVAGGVKHAIATAFLAQANGGYNTTHSKAADAPISTITNKGSQQQLVTANLVTLRKGSHSAPADEPLGTQTTSDHHGLVAAHLLHLRGNCDSRAADDPLQTISAGGQHHGLVSALLVTNTTGHGSTPADQPLPTVATGGHHMLVSPEMIAGSLSPEQLDGAVWVAAFLMKYHGMGENIRPLDEPASTVTTKDRLALVTVWISGDPYVIVDIRLRMLKPRELYRAQGFPDTYIIDRGHDGKPFTLTQQVHMCGNSVSPGTMAAFARANDPWKRRPRPLQAAAA